jgi:hypothetical protein
MKCFETSYLALELMKSKSVDASNQIRALNNDNCAGNEVSSSNISPAVSWLLDRSNSSIIDLNRCDTDFISFEWLPSGIKRGLDSVLAIQLSDKSVIIVQVIITMSII